MTSPNERDISPEQAAQILTYGGTSARPSGVTPGRWRGICLQIFARYPGLRAIAHEVDDIK